MRQYLSINRINILLLFWGIILIATYIQQEYIVIPQISNMPVADEVVKAKIFEGYYKYRWLMFVMPPVVMLLRISLVSFCLFMGGFFRGQKNQIKYTDSWNIALKSDVVLILFSLITCFISIALGTEQAADVARYNSLTFLVDANITEQWLLIPIAALNIFEVCYWFFMAKLVAVQTSNGYWDSFKFVMSTYGVGYLFYIVFLMFLLLYLM